MPWTPKDALTHTKKAKTPALQRQWAAIANSELKTHGDDARAVRMANGVIARQTAGGARRRKR